MPFISVTLIEGRTTEQKHDLLKKLTVASAEALDIDPQNVRVAIHEVSADGWGIGGEPMSKLRPA
ncbi:MAG: 2-hydroxymuconate tautomerase family protein [Candidatus Nanopelagicales bacterium]|jgi:4-oxalocrotonate tautomerase|nr:2-hydroxymuconate tautomerase family protein [Actinomycetota bacterium]NCG02527.1 2-hydroxymuconate tautomerase family protein [Actinomycetales bacterium]MBT5182691.1 2-hydroxymuconate tautomerase family protein [Actinomycetota bacterium]MBT5501065.1 2-hydroxymuconate tautomerase family protein [Actinomycetota bacterium]MBT5807570.1 2-hydroxymuconate tautomerase family protein [Actinomycetota bacterium]